jgi:hypothetical protein
MAHVPLTVGVLLLEHAPASTANRQEVTERGRRRLRMINIASLNMG